LWLHQGARERYASDAQTLRHPARASVRRNPDLRALINDGLTYSAAWPVRDLSMTGAFIEMVASDLREGWIVEFVLQVDLPGRRAEHRFPAKIARISPDGVAVEFGHYDDAAYTDLANLLYAM
jgi:hypothetical protein